MSRKRNTENEEHIGKTAFRLFLENGYHKTTYQTIAEASGNERTVVQLYFPKKDYLIIDFLNKLLDISIEYIDHDMPHAENSFVKLFCVGQIYFSFLMKNQNLTLEVFSDRGITEKILFLNEDWTYNFLRMDPSDKTVELTEDIIMYMGGAYELMYRNIVKGEAVNIPRLLKKVVVGFMTSLGYEPCESEKLLSPYHLTDEIFYDFNSRSIGELLN